MQEMKSNEKTAATKSSGREPLRPADWEQSALELIAEKGVAGLGVEPLARRMGITKGSFYWHFNDREDLLRRALSRWESLDQQHLAAFAENMHDPHENLEAFFRRTSRQQLTHQVYNALLSAPHHDVVSDVLRQVTDRRMGFLTMAYEKLGYGAGQALHHAQLTYCAYVGFLQLQRQGFTPGMGSEAFDAYTEHIIQVLLRRQP